MRKMRKNSGFTMAELLIVVAIIAILGSVSFIAVQNQQRSMAQLERDSIAREIFVAAQNHLTMADSQGYLGSALEVTPSPLRADGSEAGAKIYYVAFDGVSNPIIETMLPFGSIDETVRAGGRYIIRYQSSPARVIDVFYWTTDKAYTADNVTIDHLLPYGADSAKNGRKSHTPILGWYGGEGVLETGTYDILAPRIEVENAERLIVRVTDMNYNSTTGSTLGELKLIVSGKDAQVAFTLKQTIHHARVSDPADGVYTITLDDITRAGMHFADLNSIGSDVSSEAEKEIAVRQGTFVPGEDIVVQAVAYSNEALSNIAYSSEYTVNSLFADIDATKTTAFIGNLRHLENLDDHISDVSHSGTDVKLTQAAQLVDLVAPAAEAATPAEGDGEGDGDGPEAVVGESGDAELSGGSVPSPAPATAKDLSWQGFLKAIGGDAVKIYALSDTTGNTENTFRPVTPTYALTYDGQGHGIEGVVVDCDGDAGLFGALTGGTVKDLTLIDFDITAKEAGHNAGALAGKLTNTAVSGVLAYHGATPKTVTATASAGGLIGSMSGGSVDKSAAALYIRSSDGSAGGLIGAAADGTQITSSYSGGHTVPNTGLYSTTDFNVTATGSAGGLVGDAGNAEIATSYSTCSASGATAGGLIGSGSGKIDYCYAVGLVKSTAETPVAGAFAGKLESAASTSNCLIYELVNPGMPAVGIGTGTNIAELDADTASFNDFIGDGPTVWAPAVPYDAALKTCYEDKFDLRTVDQLGADKATKALVETDKASIVSTHYGDWPAPETFVENEKTSS